MSDSSQSSIRLNKFISDSGFCSRREADRFIEQNCVRLNGKLAPIGTRVLPGDEVKVNGQLIEASAHDKTDRVYIAYHKPVGITCTTDRSDRDNITDAVNHPERIFPIGRLDKPSEGLIFLTSDGDIVNKILRAENAHDKEYVVTVNKPITQDFIQRMSSGIPILGTVTQPCKVEMVSKFVFKIILTQGLNRQIRRMCEYLGYDVTRLVRTRIMHVSLGKLKPGHWRNLTEAEMAELNQAVAGSSKTASNTKSKTKNQSRKKSPNQNRPAKNGNHSQGKVKQGNGQQGRNQKGQNNGKSKSSKGKGLAAKIQAGLGQGGRAGKGAKGSSSNSKSKGKGTRSRTR